MRRTPHGIVPGASSRGWTSAIGTAPHARRAGARGTRSVKRGMVGEGPGGLEDGTTHTALRVAGDRSRTDDVLTWARPVPAGR